MNLEAGQRVEVLWNNNWVHARFRYWTDDSNLGRCAVIRVWPDGVDSVRDVNDTSVLLLMPENEVENRVRIWTPQEEEEEDNTNTSVIIRF